MSALPALIKDPGFRGETLKAFAKGVAFVAILMGMMFIWIILRADDTVERWQARFPSKTVLIQAPVSTSGLAAGDMITPDEAPAVPAGEEAAFYKHKKVVPPLDGHVQVAVVFTGLGVSQGFTKEILQLLPTGVTLGFSPYAPGLTAVQDSADKKGFERWLMLPLETRQFPINDPGPYAIHTNDSLGAIEEGVGRLIGMAGKGYAGFITARTHRFTTLDLRTNPMMRMIAENGFGFAEGRSEGEAFARDYAASHYIPYVRAGEWLTRNMGRAEIDPLLQRVEKLAQMNGHAVLMVEATPLSLTQINEWTAALPGRKIQIVPLSNLAQ